MEVIMKCPSFWISGAASLVLLLSASSGQAQSCLAQLQPLKPVNVICQNAVLSCVCAGTNCHWVWGCPAANPFGVALSAPQITTDPSIILGYKPGKVESPLDLQQKAVDTLIQIQTLKNLQQQNQMMERMNETPPTPSSFIPDPPHPTAPPPAAAPATGEERWQAIKTSARQRYPDWDAVAASASMEKLPLTGTMEVAIMESDFGPDLLYWLAKHPEECRRIAGLSPVSSARELGRIEERIQPAP
jgi:hypothetical protein